MVLIVPLRKWVAVPTYRARPSCGRSQLYPWPCADRAATRRLPPQPDLHWDLSTSQFRSCAAFLCLSHCAVFEPKQVGLSAFLHSWGWALPTFEVEHFHPDTEYRMVVVFCTGFLVNEGLHMKYFAALCNSNESRYRSQLFVSKFYVTSGIERLWDNGGGSRWVRLWTRYARAGALDWVYLHICLDKNGMIFEWCHCTGVECIILVTHMQRVEVWRMI